MHTLYFQLLDLFITSFLSNRHSSIAISITINLDRLSNPFRVFCLLLSGTGLEPRLLQLLLLKDCGVYFHGLFLLAGAALCPNAILLWRVSGSWQVVWEAVGKQTLKSLFCRPSLKPCIQPTKYNCKVLLLFICMLTFMWSILFVSCFFPPFFATCFSSYPQLMTANTHMVRLLRFCHDVCFPLFLLNYRTDQMQVSGECFSLSCSAELMAVTSLSLLFQSNNGDYLKYVYVYLLLFS